MPALPPSLPADSPHSTRCLRRHSLDAVRGKEDDGKGEDAAACVSSSVSEQRRRVVRSRRSRLTIGVSAEELRSVGHPLQLYAALARRAAAAHNTDAAHLRSSKDVDKEEKEEEREGSEAASGCELAAPSTSCSSSAAASAASAARRPSSPHLLRRYRAAVPHQTRAFTEAATSALEPPHAERRSSTSGIAADSQPQPRSQSAAASHLDAGPQSLRQAEDVLLRDEWLRLLAADASDSTAAAAMRALVWRGVPASIRCRVWLHLLRSRMPAADMAAYHSALQDRLSRLQASGDRRLQPAAFADIEKDVTRTLPAVWLFRTADGVAALRRLLLCFSLHSPAIGYCQGLNFIAASLLLVSAGDECAAFSLLCGLVDGRLGYYTRSMAGCVVDTAVMSDLAEYFEPELHALLLSYGLPITSFCSSWLICLFCNAPLSLPHAMRVWDALLAIGDEILFRLGLALLRHSHTRLLAVTSAEELLQLFLQQLGDIADLEPLMRHVQAQCLHDPYLSHSIASLRQFHQYEIAAEQSRLQQSSVLRLQERMPFSAEELQQLWSLFLQPQPWQTIVTGAIVQLTHFRFSFCAAVFQPAASQRFKGRGLILPADSAAQHHTQPQKQQSLPPAAALSPAALASSGAVAASASSASSSLPASSSILESRAANFLFPDVGQSSDSIFTPAEHMQPATGSATGGAAFSASALLSPRSTVSAFPWWPSPTASPTATSPLSAIGSSAASQGCAAPSSALPLASPPSSPKSRAAQRRAVVTRRRANSSADSAESAQWPPSSSSSSLLPPSFSAHRALLAASSLITASPLVAESQQPSFPADEPRDSTSPQPAASVQPQLSCSAASASAAYAASDNVLARLFVMLDGSGRGCVDFEEFCMGVALFKKSSRDERLRAAFSMADVDGDGQLSREQFARFVSMFDRLYRGQRAAAAAELDSFVSNAFQQAARPSLLLNCTAFMQIAPLQPAVAAFFRLDAARDSEGASERH